jgi:hypothetical protein
MAFGRARKELETIAMRGENFSDASHEVPVGREWASRKVPFELLNYRIQALDQRWDMIGRVIHSMYRDACLLPNANYTAECLPQFSSPVASNATPDVPLFPLLSPRHLTYLLKPYAAQDAA